MRTSKNSPSAFKPHSQCHITMHGVTWLGPINRGSSLAMNVHANIHTHTRIHTNIRMLIMATSLIACVRACIYHTLCELHVPQAPAFICVCFIVINPIQVARSVKDRSVMGIFMEFI